MNVSRIVLGSVILMFALVGIVLAFYMFNLSQASSSWPSTSGMIVVSELDELMAAFGKAKAKVEYTYSVDGQKHTGFRIGFAEMTGSG